MTKSTDDRTPARAPDSTPRERVARIIDPDVMHPDLPEAERNIVFAKADAILALPELGEVERLTRERDEARRAAGLGCDANAGGAHDLMTQGSYRFCKDCGETITAPDLRERARLAETAREAAERARDEATAEWKAAAANESRFGELLDAAKTENGALAGNLELALDVLGDLFAAVGIAAPDPIWARAREVLHQLKESK